MVIDLCRLFKICVVFAVSILLSFSLWYKQGIKNIFGGYLIMKNKYLLFCVALSIFLALSGCGENENPQEDSTYNQYLHYDDHVDESSDNSIDESETSNEILDNSSQSTGDNTQDNSNEQSDGQNNSNEQSNISDNSNENAYFLSTNSDFYEKVACNPIDQKYVIDGEAAPLEIWQSALEKCEAWNQQIDFTGFELESSTTEIPTSVSS